MLISLDLFVVLLPIALTTLVYAGEWFLIVRSDRLLHWNGGC